MLSIRTKCAFTLTELIIVVIIVGILTAIAVLNFITVTENTRAKEAISSLKQIKAAETIYRYGENTYWPAGATKNNITTINTQLRLDLDERTGRNWDYSITATADTFTATATRTSGRNDGETITVDQAGTIDYTGWSP